MMLFITAAVKTSNPTIERNFKERKYKKMKGLNKENEEEVVL
jgi:hypothetical protein